MLIPKIMFLSDAASVFIPFSQWRSLRIRFAAIAVLATMLTGCSSRGGDALRNHQIAKESALPSWMHADHWKHQVFPSKTPTRYTKEFKLGRSALAANADNSLSIMRIRTAVEVHQLESLQFSWLARDLLVGADVAMRDSEDAKLRVVLSFDGDRQKFSAKNRMLSELSLVLTGEELPYATLMYVWCNTRHVGEIITNPRSDRIRKIVLESGPKNLGKWLDYERNIRADFIAAFGEEPGALTGIALMTDTDNTRSRATAWYGPVRLTPAPIRPALP